MTAPVVASHTDTDVQNASAFSPGLPSGTAENDLLIAFGWIDGISGETFSTPTGWTLLESPTTTSVKLYCWWKLAGASESGTTFNASGTADGKVICLRITGAPSSAPIDDSAAAVDSLDAPSVTTTAADDLLLHVFGHMNAGSITVTHPSGDTLVDSEDTDIQAVTSSRAWGSTGATGTFAFDDGFGTSDQVTISVAILTEPLDANIIKAGSKYYAFFLDGELGE